MKKLFCAVMIFTMSAIVTTEFNPNSEAKAFFNKDKRKARKAARKERRQVRKACKSSRGETGLSRKDCRQQGRLAAKESKINSGVLNGRRAEKRLQRRDALMQKQGHQLYQGHPSAQQGGYDNQYGYDEY
jgi:hypothetical protein